MADHTDRLSSVVFPSSFITTTPYSVLIASICTSRICLPRHCTQLPTRMYTKTNGPPLQWVEAGKQMIIFMFESSHSHNGLALQLYTGNV